MTPAKNGTEMAQKNSSIPTQPQHPKTDFRYWENRIEKRAFEYGGDVRVVDSFSVRMAHKGERLSFPLGASAKREAAKKAAEIFVYLRANGAQAARVKYIGDTVERDPNSRVTVGDLLAAARSVSSARPTTFKDYQNSFRRIVADVKGIAGGVRRFDYAKGGNMAWAEKIEKVFLDEITPEHVTKWAKDFVRRKGAGDPVKERSAMTSANSIINQARSLFGRKIVRSEGSRHLIRFVDEKGRRTLLELPEPLPFGDGLPFKGGDMRYVSKIDPEKLIHEARKELGEARAFHPEECKGDREKAKAKFAVEEASRREQFKILILALFAGLRANEIDKLIWRQFDFDAGLIRMEATSYLTLKSEKSAGEVELDPEVVELFRGYRAAASGEFVIESANRPNIGSTSRHYRAQRDFDRLRRWLKTKGVGERKALHTLRKKFGSLICQKMGIFAASSALRHADIGITARHYTARKERISVGLGSTLSEKMVELSPESSLTQTKRG